LCREHRSACGPGLRRVGAGASEGWTAIEGSRKSRATLNRCRMRLSLRGRASDRVRVRRHLAKRRHRWMRTLETLRRGCGSHRHRMVIVASHAKHARTAGSARYHRASKDVGNCTGRLARSVNAHRASKNPGHGHRLVQRMRRRRALDPALRNDAWDRRAPVWKRRHGKRHCLLTGSRMRLSLRGRTSCSYLSRRNSRMKSRARRSGHRRPMTRTSKRRRASAKPKGRW
jgi:hypothetical protein